MSRLLALVFFLAITGCDREEPVAVQDYIEGLARVLGEDADLPVEDGRLDYPRVRDLQIQFEDLSINLLEFLALGDCELQAVVARGNSSLGRLALPSQKLVYELDFLRAGSACLALMEDESLQGTLIEVLQKKEQQLGARIWMATLGSEEFRHFWMGTAVPPDAELLHALRMLADLVEAWGNGSRDVNGEGLEGLLQKIDSRDAGGMLRRWEHIAARLPVATGILLKRLARKPLCYPGMKTGDADIFYRVVRSGFITGIQRDIARMNRVTFDLMKEIHQLEQATYLVETPAYRVWRIERDQRIADARKAVQDHVSALEPLMEQCGFLPESENNSGEEA